MNTRLLVGILLAGAVLGGIAWYASTLNTKQLPLAENPEESWTLSASFMCVDGTHFVAEFPSADSVEIFVDGVRTRTLPLITGLGQRFEDAAFAYVFAGEEVTVTDKVRNATTNCSQPFDANNAPVNFGDAGEGGGVKQDVKLIVTENMIGTWQSVEDPKFVREFKGEDVVSDRHDGKEVSNGLWVVFTKETAPEVPYPLESNTTYVQMTMKGTQADTLYFRVAKVTPEELELVYMDRGGVLAFRRMQ